MDKHYITLIFRGDFISVPRILGINHVADATTNAIFVWINASPPRQVLCFIIILWRFFLVNIVYSVSYDFPFLISMLTIKRVVSREVV